MKVIGIREQECISKKTCNKYMAVILHCTYTDKNIQGQGVERLFLKKENVAPNIRLGDEIKVSYNRFGNIDTAEKVM